MTTSVLPTLIVVSGPAGSGKTTLAHRLAKAVGCPAICRDEIKEGMVHATPGFRASVSDPLTVRTLGVYFEVLEMLLRAGVTLVAEAAFQDRIWRPRLEPFAEFADIRVVRCSVDADTADQRIVRRMEQNSLRAAHADTELLQARANGVHLASGFGWITLDVPNLEVDTSDGYRPGLEEIVEFANRPGG